MMRPWANPFNCPMGICGYRCTHKGGWGSLPTYKFRISSRLLYVVQQAADKLGIPVSRLIRVAIVSYLEKLPLEL